MASKAFLGLILIHALCFSHVMIIFSNAVPVTRTERLMHNDLPQRMIGDQSVNERMAIELNDYPGSGANNRHTPRPQFGRCADC